MQNLKKKLLLDYLHVCIYEYRIVQRIQFCSPASDLGGPGRLRMTSLASWDFSTITSFSRTAVCIRRTLRLSLQNMKNNQIVCQNTQEQVVATTYVLHRY